MEDLIDSEVERGTMVLPQGVSSYELAYVLERVMAGYVYLDLITGEAADASRAAPILRMLLDVTRPA